MNSHFMYMIYMHSNDMNTIDLIILVIILLILAVIVTNWDAIKLYWWDLKDYIKKLLGGK